MSFNDKVCERCGSKKHISKSIKEYITNSQGGQTSIEVSYIICENKECEESFQLDRQEQRKKYEDMKEKKASLELSRRANSLLAHKKTALIR